MLMINNAVVFEKKVKSLNRDELEKLVHRMANHLDDILEEDGRLDDYACLLPRDKQTMPFIQDIMDILDYE